MCQESMETAASCYVNSRPRLIANRNRNSNSKRPRGRRRGRRPRRMRGWMSWWTMGASYFVLGLECGGTMLGSAFTARPQYHHRQAVQRKKEQQKRKMLDWTRQIDHIRDQQTATKMGKQEDYSSMESPTNKSEEQEEFQLRMPPLSASLWKLSFSTKEQEQLTSMKQMAQTIINEPLVEIAGVVLLLVSSVLVAINTLPDLPWEIIEPLEEIQQVLSYLFFGEFVIRWLASTDKAGRYVTQPLVIVDVLVVVIPVLFMSFPLLAGSFLLPDFMSGQSGLFNLRLLRLLRLQRVLQDEMIFSRFLYSINLSPKRNLRSKIVQQWELQLARVVLSVFTLLSVASGLIYSAEHLVNPELDNFFAALYFTLTTLTTVGFGDITPITWQGKLIVSGSILGGITIIPSQTAALVEALLQRDQDKKRELEESTLAAVDRQSNRLLASSSGGSGGTTPHVDLELPLSMTTMVANANETDSILEPSRKCPVCHVGLHWSHAQYCYNCASPLDNDEVEEVQTTRAVLPEQKQTTSKE